MIRSSLIRSGRPIAAVAALLVLAVALPWALSAGGPEVETPETAAFAPGLEAARVAIDPETGELGPAPAGEKVADEQLRQMLRRDSEGLTEVVHPDGSASIDLQGRFMNASLARLGADGEVETVCTTDHDHAADFLAGAADEPEVR